MGDLLYTGTPAGVGPVRPGDTLLILGDEENGMIVTKPDVLNNLAAKILDQIGNEK